MDSSDHIDFDCCHFDYTFWAIQLHVRVGRVQDTAKFVDKYLGCHSRGVNVNEATHTVTTFPVPRMGEFLSGFSTVFQSFLTVFLIDSGYKTSIRMMDELLDSGIKLAYPEG